MLIKYLIVELVAGTLASKNWRDEMPIVNFTRTKEEAQSVKGATNIRQGSSDDIWLYDTHTGLCVAQREMNGYNDSDFYMTVYEPETDSFKEICFATTRAWSYPCFASKVDAPPEIMQKYEQHLREIQEQKCRLIEKQLADDPSKDKMVEVIRGRKHKGKVGLVFWRGVNKFKSRYCDKNLLSNQVVGIEQVNTGQRFFVPADYVKVIRNCQWFDYINKSER